MSTRRTFTTEEQLKNLSDEISKRENTLKTLKEKKKSLETKLKVERLEKLNELFTKSGKTFEELQKLLLS